jgi:hypothetical protein
VVVAGAQAEAVGIAGDTQPHTEERRAWRAVRYLHPCVYCEPVCLQDTLTALTPGLDEQGLLRSMAEVLDRCTCRPCGHPFCLCTPEMQWQSRGKSRILQGCRNNHANQWQSRGKSRILQGCRNNHANPLSRQALLGVVRSGLTTGQTRAGIYTVNPHTLYMSTHSGSLDAPDSYSLNPHSTVHYGPVCLQNTLTTLTPDSYLESSRVWIDG